MYCQSKLPPLTVSSLYNKETYWLGVQVKTCPLSSSLGLDAVLHTGKEKS